MRNKR